jgi:hypothetical protein
MATVYVPGVAVSVIRGNIGANPWAVVHHWQFGTSTTPWNSGDIATLATAVFTAWQSRLKGSMGPNVEVHEVDTVDLSNATGVGNTHTVTPVFGGLSSPLEPSSMCLVQQNKIAARYRGGHPRTYWPIGSQAQLANENTWQTGPLGVYQTQIDNFFDDVLAAGYTASPSLVQVIPRFSYTYVNDPVGHKYKKERTGLLAVSPVLSHFLVTRVGSQRKRLSP